MFDTHAKIDNPRGAMSSKVNLLNCPIYDFRFSFLTYSCSSTSLRHIRARQFLTRISFWITALRYYLERAMPLKNPFLVNSIAVLLGTGDSAQTFAQIKLRQINRTF